MNIALVFAGGTGQRMNTASSPKQFLNLHGKPIIIYTLEQFEANEEIDAIVVVCLEGWIDHLKKKIRQFGLAKVTAIIPGGETGFKSIQKGVLYIGEHYDGDSVVLIHDGVRPLVDQETIRDCIDSTHRFGSGIAASPAIETIMVQKDDSVDTIIDRSNAFIARAPQCFILKDILQAHEKAIEDGRDDFIDSVSLMIDFGHKPHIVQGNSDNIKITTPSDFYTFRALIDARENAQIFGI